MKPYKNYWTWQILENYWDTTTNVVLSNFCCLSNNVVSNVVLNVISVWVISSQMLSHWDNILSNVISKCDQKYWKVIVNFLLHNVASKCDQEKMWAMSPLSATNVISAETTLWAMLPQQSHLETTLSNVVLPTTTFETVSLAIVLQLFYIWENMFYKT